MGCALSRGALGDPRCHRARTVRRRQFDGALPRHLAWRHAALLVVHPASARVLAEAAAGSVTDVVTRLIAFVPPERVVIAPAIVE